MRKNGPLLSLRSSEFEKAKSEVELRYKGTNIRKDCGELTQQFNNYNDAIQKSQTKINSYNKRVEELSKKQFKIDMMKKILIALDMVQPQIKWQSQAMHLQNQWVPKY